MKFLKKNNILGLSSITRNSSVCSLYLTAIRSFSLRHANLRSSTCNYNINNEYLIESCSMLGDIFTDIVNSCNHHPFYGVCIICTHECLYDPVPPCIIYCTGSPTRYIHSNSIIYLPLLTSNIALIFVTWRNSIFCGLRRAKVAFGREADSI